MRLWVVLCAILLGGAAEASCPEGTSPGCDGQSAVYCADGDGGMRKVPCRGPEGCRVHEGRVTCDTSWNARGDACAPAQEGGAQCSHAEPKLLLSCLHGTFVARQICPTRCVQDGARVRCE
jgi:hypothetical protein